MADIKVKVGLNIKQAMAWSVLGDKVKFHDWEEQEMIYKNGAYIILKHGSFYRAIPEHGALDLFAREFPYEYIGPAWEII